MLQTISKRVPQYSSIHVLLDAVFIYPDVFCVLVCVHDLLQQLLLEVHCRRELLTSGANARFEANHIELQVSASNDTLDQFGKAVFRAAGEEHTQGIFLLHRQLHKLYYVLIPPALPSARLLFLHALAGRRQYAGVVPPTPIYENVGRRELSHARAIPNLLVWQRTCEECIVEVVDVDGLDVGNWRQIVVVA